MSIYVDYKIVQLEGTFKDPVQLPDHWQMIGCFAVISPKRCFELL